MMRKTDDKELLNAIQRGDIQAFEIIFNRYWKPLFSLVCAITKDDEITKDILQNTFSSFWERRQTFFTEDSLLPLLNRMARNDIINQVRKNKVRLAWEGELVDELKSSMAADANLIARELRAEIDAEIIRMPHNMKHCFQLSRQEDQTIKEIALKLSLSEQTVKNNISEALKRLRSHIRLIES